MRSKTEENSEISVLRPQLEEILKGPGFNLIELTISRHRGSVQVKAVIYNGSPIGTDHCTKVHRAIMPKLELAFPHQDVYLEVSSPGIDRLIKDKKEFAYYLGKKIRCYRTDITEWTLGVLESVCEDGIELNTKEGIVKLNFDIIAKAKLDSLGG